MMQDPQGMELAKMRQWLDFRGKSVLEVGCGDGRATAMLACLSDKIAAIDPDPARLEKARESLPHVDFRLGTGEALDFPDGSFDIVAFTFSLHHQDSIRAISEARRVLRPGGNVLIIEPSLDGDMHPLFRIFNFEDDRIAGAAAAIHDCEMDLAARDEFGIEYVFDDIEDVYDYFFGHYGIHRDAGKADGIRASLGGKAAMAPMTLIETVNLTVLTKSM